MIELIGLRDRALKKSKDEAETARSEADRANAMKSDFLATMSHEIRTPMNGIIGMTELLLDSPLNHKQASHAQTVIGSAEALLNIINDILDFSKIEAGKLDLEPISFDLMKVVDDTAELLSIKAREKALELIVRYKPGTPRYLIGDPGRIRQIMSNLLGNAIKFTERGYVLVTIEAADEVAGKTDTTHLKISVKDTGIGIDDEAQKKLFNKFTQADTSTTRKFGVTGLGLAICKQLAAMMDGNVGMSSVSGRGSTFWFTMNLKKDDGPIDEEAKHALLSDLKILVVDDIPINGTLLTEQLENFGATVECTSKPKDAITMLRVAQSSGAPFNVALIDYLMPEINGEELARSIRDNEDFEDTALVMLTSAGGRGYGTRFHEAGFSAFLSKPIRARDLANTLSLVCREYAAGNTNGLIDTDSALKKSADSPIDKIRFKDTRILLAEDNRTNQAFAQEILEGAECEVDIAVNGKLALSMVRDGEYDLIFMDCEMPEMDGYEAVRSIRARQIEKGWPYIPVVAFTGNKGEDSRRMCLAAGVDDYVEKDVFLPNWCSALSDVLEKWLYNKENA